MFSEMCNSRKKGVRLVQMVGPFAILVNIERLRRGRFSRLCVVHLEEQWVEGWAESIPAAIRMAQEALTAIQA